MARMDTPGERTLDGRTFTQHGASS
jgi:hypothetical protein